MLHITEHSKGNKLDSFKSINTSVSHNPFCERMRHEDSICARCYAATMEKRFGGLRDAIKRNFLILQRPLAAVAIPDLRMEKVFRFHSLGELANLDHLKNFFKIARANPGTTFTLWSKREGIVKAAARARVKKPKNMILIYSNPDLNCDVKPPHKWFSKTFNVYDKEHAEKVKINCAGKCKDCMLCYTDNKTEIIREVVK